MKTNRRQLIAGAVSAAMLKPAQTPGVRRFVRFRKNAAVSYGLLDGDTVRAIGGSMFGAYKQTGTAYKLSEVKLLHPCEPPKILAVGLNYKSHVGNRKPPVNPEIFYKPITATLNPEDSIAIPPDSKNTHFEGELVVVVGKTVRNASPDQARDAIFGVTCGNDVSERDWQGGPEKDLQWWRAKGADTFAPFGPAIVRGLDYGKLLLQTRLNGKVMQKQNTSDLLFDCPAIVSYVSKYVTLNTGDLIYTGTPGATSRMQSGDVVEVDIEGIGVLRNKIA